MGRFTRSGTNITDFWPDDTDTEMYIDTSASLDLDWLLELLKKKWPDYQNDEIAMEAEHIHTHALGYDRYDSGDYTQFIHVTYTKLTTVVIKTDHFLTVKELGEELAKHIEDFTPEKLMVELRRRYPVHSNVTEKTVIDEDKIGSIGLYFKLRLSYQMQEMPWEYIGPP